MIDGDRAYWIVDGLDDVAVQAFAARFGARAVAAPLSLEDIFIELG